MERFDLRFFEIAEADWKDMSSTEWMQIIKNKVGDEVGFETLPKLLNEELLSLELILLLRTFILDTLFQ